MDILVCFFPKRVKTIFIDKEKQCIMHAHIGTSTQAHTYIMNGHAVLAVHSSFYMR